MLRAKKRLQTHVICGLKRGGMIYRLKYGFVWRSYCRHIIVYGTI